MVRPRLDRMFSESTSAGRSVVSARSMAMTRSTVSGVTPWPVRMIVTSSSSTRSASATSAGSPRRVTWLPRTWMSASNAFSISRRCSSPGPSRATMLMLLGTTTVCRVWSGGSRWLGAGQGARLAGLGHGCPGLGRPFSSVVLTAQCYGRGGWDRLAFRRRAASGAGDQQDPEAHLVGGALAPDDVLVGLALERRAAGRAAPGCGGR